MALVEFAANNAVNVATGYMPFFLNSGNHIIVPSVLLLARCVLNRVEAMQEMVDRMKKTLEEAQVNLTVARNRAKAYMDKSRCDKKYEIGDNVIFSKRNLHVNEHPPMKVRRH